MGPIFPKSADRVLRISAALILVTGCAVAGLFGYLALPKHTDTGYTPEQPVPYSHKLHAGNLGLDCRYCHSTVENSSFAAIPATEVCMNCHTRVKPQSPFLTKIRESYASGQPVEWVKVHRLADYVYFNHQAHVKAGVSCLSCHGRVDQMIEVRQEHELSMAWCLDCHRNPAPHVRPAEFVTKLDWRPGRDPAVLGREIIDAKRIAPPLNCSGCHR